MVVSQWWFGHRCEKMTRLYVCGMSIKDVPVMGLKLGEPEYVIAQSRKNKFRKKEVGKAEREHTPEPFARYLIEIASMCRPREVEAA